jgi:hypothetical protein
MKKIIVIHPYLFSIFPIISFYNYNEDIAKFSYIFLPIAISLVFTISLYTLLQILIKNKIKAAVISSSFLILFFSFGHVINMVPLRYIAIGKVVITTYHFIIIILIDFIIITAILIFKTKKKLISINAYLNIVAIVLVLFSLINIMTQRYNHLKITENYTDGPFNTNKKNNEYLPDIYYIVFDGYAREDILKEIYQYDNSEFIDYLTNKGFYVADQSNSNYPQTYLSVASSLNFKYINSLSEIVGEDSDDRKLLSTMIINNNVYDILKNNGYLFVSVPGCWTEKKLYADIYLQNAKMSLDDFHVALINLTPLGAVPLGKNLQLNLLRDNLIFGLNRIQDIAEINSPTFVYAHFVIPHPPFIFGKDGESINPKGKVIGKDGSHYFKIYPSKKEYKRKYKNQLIFVNKKAKKLIDEILNKSNRPPIIILQSDHGPGSLTNWDDPGKTNMKERFSILNAYYLPEEGKKLLYTSITPVNTFRVIFNYLFNYDLEILNDESYFATWDHPYKFINVTNELIDN